MPSSELPKRKRGRPSLSQTLDLNDILIAALEVFSEKGYDGAQLKDVAQKVGVTNPLISYRFENKEDLWKKAMTYLGDKLVERFEHIQSYYVDLKGTTALRAYARQYIYFLAENPPLYKIVFQEMGQENWRSQFLIEHVFSPVIWFGEKSIEQPTEDLMQFKTIPRPILFLLLWEPQVVSLCWHTYSRVNMEPKCFQKSKLNNMQRWSII